MENLDFLEKEMHRRPAEAEAEARRDRLVQQAREADGASRPLIPIDRPFRVRLGTMLIRIGTRLAA